MEYKISQIEQILFTGKQNIPWNDVEIYLKQYIGLKYIVNEYGDEIQIPGNFPDEFSESRYTKKLRGAIAKAKANTASIIDQLIANATNKRWLINKEHKHEKSASGGWYRYDSYFGLPVMGNGEETARLNIFKATLVVKINKNGLFLYDIIDIKKEASTPLES